MLSTLKKRRKQYKRGRRKRISDRKIIFAINRKWEIRSNQKIKSINDVEIDKAVVGEPIFVVYVNEQNIDLFGMLLHFTW